MSSTVSSRATSSQRSRDDRVTKLSFRPYNPADAASCLALFDSNVPAFFAASERADYESFLALPSCPYLVGHLQDGTLRACGGYFIEPDSSSTAGLAWGIVERGWQRRGLGQQLLAVRVVALRELPLLQDLVIRTSQRTEGFYACAGFRTTHSERDGHAPGIDLVEMRCRLDSLDVAWK